MGYAIALVVMLVIAFGLSTCLYHFIACLFEHSEAVLTVSRMATLAAEREKKLALLPANARYKYCPCCSEVLEYRMVDERMRLACSDPQCKYRDWNNPTGVVCVMIPTEDGRLVLARRGLNPGKGKLALIGGHMEYDAETQLADHPETTATNETEQEVGIKSIEIDRVIMIGAPGIQRVNEVIIIYLAKPISDAIVKLLRPGSDVTEVCVVSSSPADIAFPTHKRLILDWFAGHIKDNPAYFLTTYTHNT